MAEHLPAGPAELGAPMDYSAHERTYAGFLALIKIGILASVVTLLALGLFGFGQGGFWLGSVLLLMMVVATAIAIGTRGKVKPLLIVVVIGFLFLALSMG
jgi:hypothetical protein